MRYSSHSGGAVREWAQTSLGVPGAPATATLRLTAPSLAPGQLAEVYGGTDRGYGNEVADQVLEELKIPVPADPPAGAGGA